MAYIRLIRVHQWVKNLFIFFPAFFAAELLHTDVVVNLLLAFVSFSFIASSIYILNDYMDREKDRLHPEKKNRPLASGEVSPNAGLGLMVGLLLAGTGIGIYLGTQFLLIVGGYFFMNVLYSLKLKQVPLLDISIIAIGFLLRVFAGATVVDIMVSKWLILMTFLLAMLMALAKRRDDLLILKESGQEMRKSLRGYNMPFINSAMVMMGSITVVAYLMYTVSEEVTARVQSDYLYITSFFVILGVLRYLQLTIVENKSGSPTKVLLKDIPIQLLLLGWIVTFAVLLYA